MPPRLVTVSLPMRCCAWPLSPARKITAGEPMTTCAPSPVKEFAIMGDPHGADTRSLLEVINERYLPNSVLACAAPDNTEAIEAVPLLADRPLKDAQATAYVCQNFTCRAPVNTPEEL